MDRDELSDGELLEATASQPDAFAAFYDRYEIAVVGYFTRRTGDPEVAADLAAEVFAAALSAAHRCRPDNPTAAGWLFTIARNTLANSLRRGKVEAGARRRVGISDAVAFTSDELERVESAASASGWVLELLEAAARRAARRRSRACSRRALLSGHSRRARDIRARRTQAREPRPFEPASRTGEPVMTLLPEVRSQLYDAAERRARSPRTGLLGRLSGGASRPAAGGAHR